MISQFKKWLFALQPYPMEEQRRRLTQVFGEWVGNGIQIDDVLVIGEKM